MLFFAKGLSLGKQTALVVPYRGMASKIGLVVRTDPNSEVSTSSTRASSRHVN